MAFKGAIELKDRVNTLEIGIKTAMLDLDALLERSKKAVELDKFLTSKEIAKISADLESLVRV